MRKMNNSDYWAKRYKSMEDKLKDKSYEYAKNIEEQFDKAIKELDTKIRAWYQRFAVNNSLSLSDAKKILATSELEEFKWDVKEYIKRGRENAVSGEWIKELENASARVHISRLDSIKFHLRQQAEELTQSRIRNTTDAAKLAYTESYYHTAFELQKYFGVGFTMQSLNEKTLEKVLSKPWAADGADFTARCWNDKSKLILSLNREITRMFAIGASPDKAIERIAKQFKTSKSNAGRAVMTESAFFSSTAQKDCFDELGVEEYQIVGTFDKNMCVDCAEMNGRVFKIAYFKVGSTAPPFHCWCRCCIAPYFSDMEGVAERYARDAKTGKGYVIPKDITYKQWKQIQNNTNEWVANSEKSGIIELYRGKGIKVSCDSDISPKTVKQVEKATKKVTSDFKTLENYSEPIIFGDVKNGLAENSYNPRTGLNTITLRKADFANPDLLLKKLNDDFVSGISYETDTIQSLVAHEMGHNAHIALALKRANLPYGRPLTAEQYGIFENEYSKIRQEIYISAFSDESLLEIENLCINELGGITENNANELIAQSFGNYYYGKNKSKIAEEIVKYFKKGLK